MTDFSIYENRRSVGDRLIKLNNAQITNICIRITARLEQPTCPKDMILQKYFEYLDELISEAEGKKNQQQTLDSIPLTAVEKTIEILSTKKSVGSVREKLDNGYQI